MKHTLSTLSLILIITVAFSSFAGECLAQDTGDPVMKTATFYILGGTAAGAGLGFVYYMLDPLKPNADFQHNVLTGAGIGALAGMAAAIALLNRQATFPGSTPILEEGLNQEVLGSSIGRYPGYSSDPYLPREAMAFSEKAASQRDREPAIPLFSMVYSF